ncbi:MAG: homocysteine S-methyltransferase family protein [Clostridia bacterium]
MNEKVRLLDGALGTMLWNLSGTTGDVWQLNITQPDTVKKLHEMYIEAGSQIISSNTFSVNCFSIKKSDYTTTEIVSAGVKIAKQAAFGKNVKVTLDIGPLPELLEPYGDLEEEDCIKAYEEIISAGVNEKPDIIFFETFMDVEMLKIAVSVASKYDIPIFCSMTFEPIGKTMMGNSVDDMIANLKEFDIAAMGINCSNEPSLLMDVIKSFKGKTDKPLIFKPNAGLPSQQNGKDVYKSDEEIFAHDMLASLELGEIYIGGCCGTTPNHIKNLKEMIKL